MNDPKRYAIFALLLPCIIAIDIGMDLLQHLPGEEIVRNMLFPYKMLDQIEKSILAIVLLLFGCRPLFAALKRMWPESDKSSGGGSGGGAGGTGSAGGPGGTGSTGGTGGSASTTHQTDEQ